MRLIEQAWYQNHPIRWLLLPLNVLFWALSALRRSLYRYHILKQPKLDVPVVIVGNIGVGGNGKTPLVVFLVEQLQQRGVKVGVISRGYGGEKRQTPLLVTDDVTAEQAGDEPVLIYQRTKAPVAISPDRIANVELLMQQGCNMIISDDGLQHYRLKRDVELVVVDGKRRFGNGWLLPAGPLREGVWRLNYVDQVIVNGGLANVDEMAMNLTADSVVNVKSGKRLPLAQFMTDVVANNPVNALAGIGDPERFFNTLRSLGFSLANHVGFVDHHKFNDNDFAQFSEKQALIMTEKDAVKCAHLVNDNSWYLPVDASFNEQKGSQLIELIMTRCKHYGL
ncbi:tetraacyldisaccharide 4'-kinase [Thalassotalea sp. Y01]|uniref:tetraacyldisaccharide 4'-kinase n=1 Tax=Thalassotalea sp. Y01 TaxID=2729613 RepID=UPI0032B7CA6C